MKTFPEGRYANMLSHFSNDQLNSLSEAIRHAGSEPEVRYANPLSHLSNVQLNSLSEAIRYARSQLV